jgi:NCAIR mutase (PurE)-related protein
VVKDKKSSSSHSWLVNTLEKVKSGELSTAEAVKELSVLPYEDLDFAKVDHHRDIRLGFPEVIFGLGKTPDQITAIAERLTARSGRVLITRADEEAFNAVSLKVPSAKYSKISRTIVVDLKPRKKRMSGVAVICAGTSDLPVAEEAAVTAELMGNKVARVNDVGVAGIHRLLDVLPVLRNMNVIVIVAGMEGALPSVVGGMVSVPIIAVPTSIGYGASFNGLAPLLTMLNSCAPGISVVNIDNGFGAGYMAGLINLKSHKTR